MHISKLGKQTGMPLNTLYASNLSSGVTRKNVGPNYLKIYDEFLNDERKKCDFHCNTYCCAFCCINNDCLVRITLLKNKYVYFL